MLSDKKRASTLLLVLGLLILSALALLFIPSPYSQLFDEQETFTVGEASIDPRYMSEITGINTPEEMQQQYERHPEEYRFATDDGMVVMFAYPDPNIRWTGMVFVHHFPSVSEVILDYDGDGNLISLELLDASQRVTETRKIEVETLEASV